MNSFSMNLEATTLYYIAKESGQSHQDTVAMLHGMALEHAEIVHNKAKTNWSRGSSNRKRLVPNTNVSLKFSAYAWNNNIEVNIKVIGNKKLKFDSGRIETHVTESILLKGEDL